MAKVTRRTPVGHRTPASLLNHHWVMGHGGTSRNPLYDECSQGLSRGSGGSYRQARFSTTSRVNSCLLTGATAIATSTASMDTLPTGMATPPTPKPKASVGVQSLVSELFSTYLYTVVVVICVLAYSVSTLTTGRRKNCFTLA